MTSTTATIPSATASATRGTGRGARLVATHGLGHHGALRDSAVINEVAAFIGNAA